MTENEIELRRRVREAAREHVPPQHLDEVVDLAFHGLNRAFEPLLPIAKSASSSGVAICILSIALSMIATEAKAKLESLEKQVLGAGGIRTSVMVGGENG